MTLAQLLTLIDSREGAEVELKPESAWQDEYSKSMAAFANAKRGHDGHLIVGVADDRDGRGKIVGLANLKKVRDTLLSAARKVSPPLDEHIILQEFVIGPKDLAGAWGAEALADQPDGSWPRTLVAVTVPGGLPFLYNDGGTYYRRRGSFSTKMNSAEVEEMLAAVRRERTSTQFEKSPVDGAGLDDLDWEAVESYIAECRSRYGASYSSSPQALLRNLGCLAGPKEGPHPTVAGILLFGREPQSFLPLGYLTVVRYPQTEVSGEYSEIRDFKGRLPQIARQASNYILEQSGKISRLEGLVRGAPLRQYPEFCIRELVLNALIHRDYSLGGARVLVKMFADRLEISSPGALPGLVTVENLEDAEFLRNPHLARVVRDLGLIEQIGDGIDRVLREVKLDPLHPPPPRWRDTGAAVIATLYSAPEFYEKRQAETFRPEASRLREKLQALHPGLKLSPRQIAILEINLRAGTVEKKRYEEELKLARRTVERELYTLSGMGLLEASGSTRDRRYSLPGNLRLQLVD